MTDLEIIKLKNDAVKTAQNNLVALLLRNIIEFSALDKEELMRISCLDEIRFEAIMLGTIMPTPDEVKALAKTISKVLPCEEEYDDTIPFSLDPAPLNKNETHDPFEFNSELLEDPESQIKPKGQKKKKPKTRWKIYTDGSFDSSQEIGSWAYIILLDGCMVASNTGTKKTYGASCMETTAIKEAFIELKSLIGMKGVYNGITVYSDFQPIIDYLNRPDPTFNSVKPMIREAKEIRELASTIEDVRWNWIPGHNGNTWNDKCDKLCRATLKQAKARGKRRK